MFSLYNELANFEYKHRAYTFFQVFDNKKRNIFKADVRDRIIHQIIYDHLVMLYEPIFISDSYSSRNRKGHHKAIQMLRYFIKLATDGGHVPCFVLKCDIKKYFDNVDHTVLLECISEKVTCTDTMSVITEIISSFNSTAVSPGGSVKGRGIPLGNITSQIFANIYLHRLDMFIKKELQCRWYVRYNDDIAIVANNLEKLEILRDTLIRFVAEELRLNIPMEKTSIRKVQWGIDFLGYVILPSAVLLRDQTKHKMYSGISRKNVDSYLGMLKHCNSHNLKQKVIAKVDEFNVDDI